MVWLGSRSHQTTRSPLSARGVIGARENPTTMHCPPSTGSSKHNAARQLPGRPTNHRPSGAFRA